MLGLDQWIATFGGGGITMGLIVALLLGLRHATDPDHLTAVSTLVLTGDRSARRAGLLGLAWGLGHATTLFMFGLPVVLFRRFLPERLLQGAEVAIGLVVIVLAVRLLLRWWQGEYHIHPHRHGTVRHAHPHAHATAHAIDAPGDHTHSHADALGRTPLAAYGIGLVHGVGGSAGVGVLLVGAVSGRTQGVVALLVFAAATAVSMALVSTALGYGLSRGRMAASLARLVPAFGVGGLLFGAWYAVVAMR
ncbi:MAG TPA: hypothetical protein VFW66_01450 [Gemmatimonadales bacterium]|nr:hypothetical protein [Gemmatimonadales bacterium]